MDGGTSGVTRPDRPGALGVAALAMFGALLGPESVGAALGGAGADRRLARRLLALPERPTNAE